MSFFFFKQKTAYEMRISDWRSDVCSSDLFANETSRDAVFITIRGVSGTDNRNEADPTTAFHIDGAYVPRLSGANAYFYDLERVEVLRGQIGRASCRERGCQKE